MLHELGVYSPYGACRASYIQNYEETLGDSLILRYVVHCL